MNTRMPSNCLVESADSVPSTPCNEIQSRVTEHFCWMERKPEAASTLYIQQAYPISC